MIRQPTMTHAAERHLFLERQLIRGRAIGGLSANDESSLLEEMGDLWWSMTDQECDEANERAASKSGECWDMTAVERMDDVLC